MRSHRLLRRRFAACLASWFVASMQVGAATHVCPMHDAMAMRMVAAMAPQHASGHASHAEHSHSHGSRHQCTCLGACCTGAPALLAAARVTLHEPGIAPRSRSALPLARIVHPQPQYRLPYAHAPPHAPIA